MKRFDGWEPKTVYRYNANGRLVSSRPEAEWDDEQRALMLALQYHRDGCCSGCGGWLADTTDAQAEGKYSFQPVRCHRCAARAVMADRASEMYRPESLLLREIQQSGRR